MLPVVVMFMPTAFNVHRPGVFAIVVFTVVAVSSVRSSALAVKGARKPESPSKSVRFSSKVSVITVAAVDSSVGALVSTVSLVPTLDATGKALQVLEDRRDVVDVALAEPVRVGKRSAQYCLFSIVAHIMSCHRARASVQLCIFL